MSKCPNCDETISPNQNFCSGACREEWNERRAEKQAAKTPYERKKEENTGCAVISILAAIFFSFPFVAPVFIFMISTAEPDPLPHSNPHEVGLIYFFGGMFGLFAGLAFFYIRKIIRDAKEEAAEEKKNLRFPPRS